MPSKGTTTGNRRNWLQVIATGLGVIGRDATNKDLELWLDSSDARALWTRFATNLPPTGTLQNYFTAARQTSTNDDRPWSIGQTVGGKPGDVIPVDALPFVLLVWQRALAGGRILTVRQARWVARLRPFMSVEPPRDDIALEFWITTLYSIAAMYAGREQIADREGNTDGPETGDLDAVLAFGMMHVFDLNRGIGASAAQQVALKLGLIEATHERLGQTWIDDESTSALRLLADSVVEGEPYDARKAGRVAQLPFWKVVALMIGLRAVAKADDWNSLPESEQRVRAKAVRDAVELDDWNRYAELAGIDYKPMRQGGE